MAFINAIAATATEEITQLYEQALTSALPRENWDWGKLLWHRYRLATEFVKDLLLSPRAEAFLVWQKFT
ncbi:hypothetical protein [Nodosilinea sp. FACHB-13]|uniref:hypothetical protein n=1 Tax=Cyanophyceae TaxID=3028117 RepID=UPI001684F89B|nr:hypothetical protein [Nodosilinea sp. FACHB-13]MBD2109498.1 hypothetical protein [Nodosilinea sp. FACHB-13]